jgi:hypothetical protein
MAIFSELISPLLTSVQGIIGEFHLSPEEAAKAKQAIADAQSKAVSDSQQYELGLATLAAQDKISARGMNTVTKDSTAKILAIGISFGFFALLIFMAVHTVPAESRDILEVMLGSLGSAFIAVVSFYFGSSAGSAAKDETIANGVKK